MWYVCGVLLVFIWFCIVYYLKRLFCKIKIFINVLFVFVKNLKKKYKLKYYIFLINYLIVELIEVLCLV